jgi:MFS family permease
MSVELAAIEDTPVAHTSLRKVVFASSLGTVFEWYDFYLYGSLAAIISQKFFSGVNETAAFIFALLAFASGFAVRPIGALFFGRFGDMIGRKYTFLITIVLMGLSTFAVGILPDYSTWGVGAPILLIAVRLIQGLALGGEYGGAAIYVAEHARENRRGLQTAWIQTTATLGFLLSLAVILIIRTTLGEAAFGAWGWRLPFVFSILLLGVSVWIRMSLHESPVFLSMKAEGRTSKAPLTDTFTNGRNIRLILIALFGLVAGQAVIWYTGQFYPLFFLTQTLKVEPVTASVLLGTALVLGTPLILFCGWLSDRIGRKPVLVAGFACAAFGLFPLFNQLTSAVNPRLAKAIHAAPVVVVADPATCSFQFNPVGTAAFTSSCDIAKAFLTKASVSYSNRPAAAGSVAYIMVGETRVDSYEAKGLAPTVLKQNSAVFSQRMSSLLSQVGYPAKASLAEINYGETIVILTLMMALVAMVYGPIAATLVELFPAKVRYTAMSLPYHIGNGWLGGFLPTTAFAMVAATGNIYYGIWYPVVVAAISLIVAIFFLPETRHNRLSD